MTSKMKKLAIFSLSMAMCLSCGFAVAADMNTAPASVIAEEAQINGVAKVGETEYMSFADALTAVKAMTGDVTMEIYDKVTLNTSIGGSYDSLTFVGKNSKAEIYLDVQGYIGANFKKVNFTDLKLSKVAGGHIANAGFMNVAFGVYDVAEVTYTNCTFLNGAYAGTGKVTFNGCTFYRSHDKYGLWAYGDVDVTVENCTFDDYRGIKMYAEGLQKTVNLTVENTDFSALTGKPAVVLTCGESLTLEGNTYSSTGVLELDASGDGTAISSTDAITCKNDNGACGVIVDGKIYTSVTTAASKATSGSNVTLLYNTTETVTFADDVNFNANGYEATNVTAKDNIGVRIGYNYYANFEAAAKAAKDGDTLTFMKDETISKTWDERNFGLLNKAVTIDGNGKTLKFTGQIADGYNYTAAFRFNKAVTMKNLTIDMSAATSNFAPRMHCVSAKLDFTAENCTFIGNTAYTNSNAIIFGEGGGDALANANVSVKNCTFKNWKNGVSDNQSGTTEAKTVTISNSTFESASVNVSAVENVTFTNNTLEQGWVKIKSYTNPDNLTATFTGNTLTANGGTSITTNYIDAVPSNVRTDAQDLLPVAMMNGNSYMSTNALLATITSGSTITLTGDITLYQELTLPANVTFNGNGYEIIGTYNAATKDYYTVYASGDVTFVGYNKMTKFNAGANKPVITIGAGATLEMTTGRMVIGHGATFNITGEIENAKTAVNARAGLTPSLIVAGASFTGNSVNFNVKNAYLKFTAYCSSKNSSANGTFNFDVENSIWEQSGSLVFTAPTSGKDPTFNLNLKDSVLNSTSHLVFQVTKGDVVIDNSNVNVDNAKQLEVCGTMTIKNGSVVHAADATSSNAKKPGTMIVDGATYKATGEYSGSDVGTGTLIIKNGANVTLGTISKTNVYHEEDSTLTYTSLANTAVVNEMNIYNFTLTTNKTVLKASESVNVTVSIDKDYYSAEYTFTYDSTKFSCAADMDSDGVIFVSNLYDGKAKALATYTLVALNDINSVTPSDFSVMGKVLQTKEQALNSITNTVVGDVETVKVSLNYTAGVKVDYVHGYSLVLVKGDDMGYAYNGVKMFYVEAYNAYAFLVEGNVTEADIDVAISKTTTKCETIKQSYNVNQEYVADGITDIKDATVAYACSILDFDVAAYMELFLRADVNGDCRVNMVDVNAIVRNYTNR